MLKRLSFKMSIKNLKLISLLIILLISYNQCFHPVFDKDVDCTILFILCLKNDGDDTLGVRLTDMHSKDSDTKIEIYKDTCLVLPHSLSVDSIKYTWLGRNDCSIVGLPYDEPIYKVVADVNPISMPAQTVRYVVYPWDTVGVNTPYFCGNCTHTYTDTLLLP